MVEPKFTLELDSARGELKCGSPGERQPGRGTMTAHEDGHGVQGFRELGSSSYKQIDGGLTRKRCGCCEKGIKMTA